MEKIILASGSPRRIELFEKNKVDFTIKVSDVEENSPHGFTKEQVPMYLALKKALDIESKVDEGIIIAADTIVYKDEVLMKPKNIENAKYILNKLSGTYNHVVTGVAIIRANTSDRVVFYETSKVYFKKMTEQDIDDYIETGEIWDKAGAYAVQGIGSKYIERVEGDYLNVLGLPWDRLSKMLKEKFNIEIDKFE